ncbi:hypothetical protein [Kaistia terrae]|uniref:Uncharacterized protein n=1 Tax=Kaistia terrae TaxID=537017 RepID=A0ABW0PTD4_9HYPH|nr:hypothetical protein [Kaistia terrae]MCX5578562.1 hypothetical protein [Kaistia terrae]
MKLLPSGANAPPKAQKAAAGCTARGLPNFDHLGGLIKSKDSQPALRLQANYRHEAQLGRDPECCKEDSSGNPTRGRCVPIQDFRDHCRRLVLKIDICRPDRSDYIGMPPSQSIEEALENWPMLALDHPSGEQWAADVLPVLVCVMNSNSARRTPPEIVAASLLILLIEAIEHLAERKFDCLEAAAFSAVAASGGRGATDGAWLNGFRMTEPADRRKDRSGCRTFAEACGALPGNLPDWTGGAAE